MDSPDTGIGNLERGLGFLAAFASAALAVPFWERRLRHESWQDRPRVDRHHGRLTSKVGGPAWLVGVLVGASLALGARPFQDMFRLFVPLALATGLGRLDDLDRVRPGPKLLGQILLLVVGFVALTRGEVATRSPGEWLLIVSILTVLQLALHINDHLDGLLTTTTVVGLATIALFPAVGPLPATLAAVGAGAGGGFLLWNRPRARAFLGNFGSSGVAWWTTLVLALVWLGPEAGSEVHWSLITPMAWPLTDFTFVCVRRLRRGVSPWTGGRDHLAHAVSARFGDRAAWMLATTVSLLGAVVAWIFP